MGTVPRQTLPVSDHSGRYPSNIVFPKPEDTVLKSLDRDRVSQEGFNEIVAAGFEGSHDDPVRNAPSSPILDLLEFTLHSD